MNTPDWTLYRSFLTVAETGSLSAAARFLGSSQPTLGRHIAELEASLQVALFTRAQRGYVLTDAGAAMVPAARGMRDAAAQLALIAAGREQSLSGAVRLTASRIVSHHILPPMLAALRIHEPGIEIELVPSDSTENLSFREADIALRMYRPTQSEVVMRHLCDLPMAIYAAKSYLDRRGRPQTTADLLTHDFIGLDKSDLILRMMTSLGISIQREDFVLRCDDQVVYWNLLRAGCGLGGGLALIAATDPLVERAAPFIQVPALPVWLVAPEALRQNPRVRRVMDHLAGAFRQIAAPL